MEKNWVPFFPPKLGYFWGPFEKFDRKQGKREYAIIKMIETSVVHHFL